MWKIAIILQPVTVSNFSCRRQYEISILLKLEHVLVLVQSRLVACVYVQYGCYDTMQMACMMLNEAECNFFCSEIDFITPRR